MCVYEPGNCSQSAAVLFNIAMKAGRDFPDYSVFNQNVGSEEFLLLCHWDDCKILKYCVHSWNDSTDENTIGDEKEMEEDYFFSD